MSGRYKGVRTDSGKACPKCNELKPFDQYGKNRQSKDGLSVYCRDCKRSADRRIYHAGHGEKFLAERKALKRHYIDKMGGRCARCGYNEFVSGFDFHHLENKEKGIAFLISFASQPGASHKHTETLEAELAKCVLLCANCHGGLHAGEWSFDRPTYTKRGQFVPDIQPMVNELDNLPLFGQT